MVNRMTLMPDTWLDLLAELIHERTGITYQNGRVNLLADKLTPLIQDKGLNSFLEYYYLLKYDQQNELEWRKVESALAVNETYFWREFSQIQAAAEVVVPQFLAQFPGLPVRIWHAACASGEEPYSMAMALMEAGCYETGSIEILGTDFNENALATARAGLYRERSFRSLPPDLMLKYFSPAGEKKYLLSDTVRTKVHFQYMNLMDEKAVRQMPPISIVFCRNAFIYFSAEAMRQITDRFAQVLQPHGLLFVAAAESLIKITNAFELTEVGDAFAYKLRKNTWKQNLFLNGA